MSERAAGYRQIDHTADLALEIWAPTEAELLATGARALIEILTDDNPPLGDSAREIVVDAVDAEDRLVQWLNEIIVAAIVEGFVFTGVDTIELARGPATSARLRASIRGQKDAGQRVVTELKSVTYHDLTLTVTAERAECHVVIDV